MGNPIDYAGTTLTWDGKQLTEFSELGDTARYATRKIVNVTITVITIAAVSS